MPHGYSRQWPEKYEEVLTEAANLVQFFKQAITVCLAETLNLEET